MQQDGKPLATCVGQTQSPCGHCRQNTLLQAAVVGQCWTRHMGQTDRQTDGWIRASLNAPTVDRAHNKFSNFCSLLWLPPLPQRASDQWCLSGCEVYQNCSVLCCVQQSCTIIHIYSWSLQLTVSLGLVFLSACAWFSIWCVFSVSMTFLFNCCLLSLQCIIIYSLLAKRFAGKNIS